MKFIDEARAYQDNMIEDLRQLVKIESVRDDAAATKEAPFGPNIAKCLDKALEIGKRDGFKVENVDGYAGVIQYGDLEESVGVLGHLDLCLSVMAGHLIHLVEKLKMAISWVEVLVMIRVLQLRLIMR